ncbi:M24 family metallopeptidase [Phytohalomonas tamaricis]|uniref:M24 family metallopeptidase n=1 Tax=Phytohalomonas tamaricis TaxID=2081032 RepID=UPI0021D454F1|nr:M24 family metallopeptidase [Phytohalomonas tamaricis]
MIFIAYLKASRQSETDAPYPGIIACNDHAGVLHYQHYDDVPPKIRYSLLVDAGCSFAGYSADITRTWCGPSAHPLFSEMVQGIEHYQQRLVSEAQAGMDFILLHRRMHDLLAALLIELGLVKAMTIEACVASGLTRALCPHGLGHSLGLQTHDVAGFQQDATGTIKPPPNDAPALRLTRHLSPGMVITIEPGCYFIDSLLAPMYDSTISHHVDWQAISALKAHGGIRIEDNIVIMPQGNENLTRPPASGL